HHYFFNSTPLRDGLGMANPQWYVDNAADPVADMLHVYDAIVGEYVDQKGVEFIVATGLWQEPYDRVKYYYRLKDHASFLRGVGVGFHRVVPRMTRDFLIEFRSAQEAADAQVILSRIRVLSDEIPLFGEIENRGDSLFVTLTYP